MALYDRCKTTPTAAALLERWAVQYFDQQLPDAETRQLIDLIRAKHHHAAEILEGLVEIRVTDDMHFELCYYGRRMRLRRLRLTGEGPRSRFSEACRAAVRDQVQDVRQAAPDQIECEVLGGLWPKSLCDVDHAPPWTFARIVERFLLDHRMTDSFVEQVQYVLDRDASGRQIDSSAFKDQRLVRGFSAYHADLAELRMISRIANRVILPRERHEPSDSGC